MKLNGNDRKLLSACLAAVAVLLAGGPAIRWGLEQRRPHSPSAVLLAMKEYPGRRAYLRDQARALGDTFSAEAVDSQLNVLRSHMTGLGGSAETIEGVMSAVHSAGDTYTYRGSARFGDQMWPVTANSGYVNGHKVWLVYYAFWRTSLPKTNCGTGLDDPFYPMDSRVYVVSDETPHRVWLEPGIYRLQFPSQQANYIRDDEYLDPAVQDQMRGF